MNRYFKNLARVIARTMLFIKATTYREEPYKWASGMMMHIYNDNRMMLGLFSHRWRVAQGFVAKIRGLNIFVDYILGTSMSGIAPATSVAQIMKKQLLINDGGKFYLYEENLLDKKTLHFAWFKILLKKTAEKKLDYAIVTTSPLAIPYGVQYANKLKVGFAYIRNPKDHGKKQEIEGNLKPGMKVILMFTGIREEDVMSAHQTTKKILEDKGCIVMVVHSIDFNKTFHREILPEELKGQSTIVIEDLFSTGGSSAYEVYQLRQAGATCNNCFSIFSYGFDVLRKQFSGESEIGGKGVKLLAPCNIDTLLPFPILCVEMERLNFFTPQIRDSMKEEINDFDEKNKKFIEVSKA